MTKWMYWDEVAAEVFPQGGGQRVAYCGALSDPEAVANAKAIVADHNELAALRERVAELEGKVTAIVGWLEREQPDVFRRGLWDALREVQSAGTGL